MKKDFQHIFFDLQQIMYQKLKDDLPDPDNPVITEILFLGINKSMFLRLCKCAPAIIILFFGSSPKYLS